MEFGEFKDLVFEAGVIGAGGAGFPTHIKLVENMDYLVINGAECEPLMYTDYELMDHYSEALVTIIREVLKVLNIKKAVWGIKSKHKDLIGKLRTITQRDDQIEICALSNVYPAGDELTLIYKCTGIVVPKGQLPSSKKIIELNVETLFNMYLARYEKTPMVDKYVTVAGIVEEPKVFKVPIGTPFKQLIKKVNPLVEAYDLLLGGPMMGNFVSLDGKVTKTTKAIILLPKESPLYNKKKVIDVQSMKRVMSSCSQCRMCTDLCPRNGLGHQVEPHKLMNAFANGILNHTESLKTALGCCGCNACSYYACHHDLMPSQFMMMTKQELLRKGIRPEADTLEKPKPPIEVEIPANRLLDKLGLRAYDKHAYLAATLVEVDKVHLSLDAHIGKAAVPIVQVGDMVMRKQKIASGSKEGISAHLHSSIDGIVKTITPSEIVIERR